MYCCDLFVLTVLILKHIFLLDIRPAGNPENEIGYPARYQIEYEGGGDYNLVGYLTLEKN